MNISSEADMIKYFPKLFFNPVAVIDIIPIPFRRSATLYLKYFTPDSKIFISCWP